MNLMYQSDLYRRANSDQSREIDIKMGDLRNDSNGWNRYFISKLVWQWSGFVVIWTQQLKRLEWTTICETLNHLKQGFLSKNALKKIKITFSLFDFRAIMNKQIIFKLDLDCGWFPHVIRFKNQFWLKACDMSLWCMLRWHCHVSREDDKTE